MNVFENHAGISLSTTRLQLVEISLNDDRNSISNFDEAYYTEPLNFQTEKPTKLSALLQGAFNEILIRKPLKTKSISFSLPLDLFYFIQTPVDNSLLQSEMNDQLKWELSVAYPFINPDEVVFRITEIPAGKYCDFPTAIVAAINRKYLGIINTFCELNKLKLRFVDNIHFACERTLQANSQNNDGVSLSLYISNSILSLMYTYKGSLLSFRVVHFESISNISEIIRNDISQNRLLNITAGDISDVYIFGDDITDGFASSLSSSVNIKLIKLNPFINFRVENNSTGFNFQSERFNSFASAAGIAYRTA